MLLREECQPFERKFLKIFLKGGARRPLPCGAARFFRRPKAIKKGDAQSMLTFFDFFAILYIGMGSAFLKITG